MSEHLGYDYNYFNDIFMIVGTPDEFVQALYSVGRGLRIAGDGSSTSSTIGGIGGIGGLGFGRAGAAAAGFKSTSEDESDTNSPGQSTNPTNK